MLIYLLSNLVCLYFHLPCVIPSLQCVFPIGLFITHESWAKVIMLFCFVALAYDMIKLLVMKQSGICTQHCCGFCTLGVISLKPLIFTLFNLFSSEAQPTKETSYHILPFPTSLVGKGKHHLRTWKFLNIKILKPE